MNQNLTLTKLDQTIPNLTITNTKPIPGVALIKDLILKGLECIEWEKFNDGKTAKKGVA